MPDAESVTDALAAAFATRPDWSRGVVLRLWRTDGPLHAIVLFERGAGGSTLMFQRGDGRSFLESTSVAHLDRSSPDTGGVAVPNERIARALRRAADGDWILDLRLVMN